MTGGGKCFLALYLTDIELLTMIQAGLGSLQGLTRV